jgi:hypothetical protein
MSWDYIRIPVEMIVALATVIGTLLTYKALYRDKHRIRLSHAFLPPLSLVSVEKNLQHSDEVSRIQVRYDSQPVSDVFILQVIIKNTGYEPITEEMYYQPITFRFPDEMRVLSVSVNHPGYSLPPVEGDTSQHTGVTFDLLNPGDKAYVQFVCTGVSCQPRVETRIRGLRRVEELKEALVEVLSLGLEDTPVMIYSIGLFAGFIVGVMYYVISPYSTISVFITSVLVYAAFLLVAAKHAEGLSKALNAPLDRLLSVWRR